MTTNDCVAKMVEPLPKLPPHSVEIEAQVLGCLVTSPGLAPEIERLGINRLSFYDLRHQTIFNAIQAVIRDGKLPDLMTLFQRLQTEKKVEDVGGLAFLMGLDGMAGMFEQYVASLHDLRTRRELLKQAACIEARAHDLLEPLATLQTDLQQAIAATNSRKSLPEIQDACAFLNTERPAPRELVYGLLHQGSKLVLGGGSKTFKTWTLMDLALSIACGEPWLSFKTGRGKVLYLNFELSEHQFQKRLAAIAQSKNITLKPGDIDLWNLRGQAASYEVLFPKILERIKTSSYALIVLDPIYKCYGDTDENSAGEVAMLLNAIEQLAVSTGAAVAFGAHYAKGNAAGKEAIDRISGSGVFARDPDSILNFTRHETEDAFTVEATLRNFKPIPAFVVKWIYPLMRRDEDLDPRKLRRTNAAGKRIDPLDLLAVIADSSSTCPVSVSEWAIAAKVKRSTLYEHLPIMVTKGWVEVIGESSAARRYITEAGLTALRERSKPEQWN